MNALNLDRADVGWMSAEFTSQERADLCAFHFFLSHYQTEVNEIFQRELKKHPMLGNLMLSIPTQVMSANRLRVVHNREQALLHNNWQPYLSDLKEQGTNLAKMGISFRTWYDMIITSLRHLETKLEEYSENDLQKAMPLIRGMRIFIDHSMCAIAETQLTHVAALLERSKEQQEQYEISHYELIYAASHNLQEPLTRVKSLVDVILEEGRDYICPMVSGYLSNISESTDRMNVLVADLLNYSRIGAMSKPEKTNINELVHGTIQQLSEKGLLNSEQVTYSELPETMILYPEEIKLVFYHLLHNAIKYKRNDVALKLNIISVQFGNICTISISDNGIGIPERSYERIFGIFKRLNGDYDQKSTGIGLAICRKVVEMHGGKMWVESSVGEGSTFNFSLPVLETE